MNEVMKLLANKLSKPRIVCHDSDMRHSKTVGIMFELSDEEIMAVPGGLTGPVFIATVASAAKILDEIVDAGLGVGDVQNFASVIPALKTIGRAMR